MEKEQICPCCGEKLIKLKYRPLIGDPFAGGSVRGIVAHKMGYRYIGIELSTKQVEANREQAKKILEPDNQPTWINGDSNEELDKINEEFDFIFSCPPYANLEVYSTDPKDLSNMPYEDFLLVYRSIINKTIKKLKPGHLAVFVVGDVRDAEGYYIDFISDTKKAFIDSGAGLYNEAILLDPIGTAMIRANNNFSSKKLVKVHQNILCFKKYGNFNALTKKIILDYIRNCSEPGCNGKITRIDKGRICDTCMKEY
jgi:DNA modification methylase